MGLLDLLKQVTGSAGTNPADHFDQVAAQASPAELGRGLAAAMRSDETPPFGSMVGQLFGQSSPTQQAGLLNRILAGVGPTALSGLGGGVLGRILGGAGSSGATVPQVTPEQASQLTPAQVSEIAAHAEQTHPGIVDQVGDFYAQHSGLIKMLGGAVLLATLSKMKDHATGA